jgi:hypothetical protein
MKRKTPAKKGGLSDEMKAKILHDHFAKLGKRGGKARFARMSASAKKRLARKAARARWSKQKDE